MSALGAKQTLMLNLAAAEAIDACLVPDCVLNALSINESTARSRYDALAVSLVSLADAISWALAFLRIC